MDEPSFDFIIVGGGTAGSVLASRLSASLPNLSFLLIEAGPDSHPSIETPLAHLPGAGIEWQNETVPQKHAGDAVINSIAGKVLGGSSAINYCAWARGPAVDFDQWSSLVEDPRWSWAGMLPYFKKSESFHQGEQMVDLSLHAPDGPVKISSNISSTLRDFVADVYESAGITKTTDMNGGHPIGYSEFYSSIYEGKRQWASQCYRSGSNVTVMTNARVDRVIIEHNRATGVEVSNSRSESPKIIRALREVVISAGAYGTPKVLLLSGIGEKSELDRHGITQLVDLPVGNNLSDHPVVQTFWKIKDGHTITGEGCPLDWIGWHRTDPNTLRLADQELTGIGLKQYTAPGKVHAESFIMYGHFSFKDWTLLAPENSSTVTMFNILVNPTSRGSVTLASSKPEDPVVIDPNILATQLDRQTLHGLTKVTNEALESEVGRKMDVEEFGITEDLRRNMSMEAFKKRMEKTVLTFNHPSGTCAMGSVVDSSCCVYGVEGLRVVDASVFPLPMAAHYQAIVYAVAEQVADIITVSTGENN
ncbi:GMC oxidoreductase [Lepidopterella palustris CBS 459.81]|uniref:GMC oxidoreductase n=1 Tax=Lepidopterella palustris CBS 459.81 TaxID=1314670 RepID=A0A8E2EIS5_9PEZI|nr:GMC oxidoreductase [Lepidopterella palustris CBS 459.81]